MRRYNTGAPTGMHLDTNDHISPPVAVSGNTTTVSFTNNNMNDFNSLATGGGMDTGGSQLQSDIVQQRKSPTSVAVGIDMAAAAVKPLPDNVGHIGNLISTELAPAPGGAYSPMDDLDTSFLDDLGIASVGQQMKSATDKRINDLEQRLKETKAECGSKIDALEAKVAEKNSEVDKLASKLDALAVKSKKMLDFYNQHVQNEE